MAALSRVFLALMIACLVAMNAQAQTAMDPNYRSWLDQLEEDAIASGISRQTVMNALEQAILDERVIALDQKQPESTITFDSYVHRIVSQERIDAGQKRIEENSDVLNDIAQRYGVPSQIIIALWGMESSFGHYSGDYNVIDSLLTLAYNGRRAAFFRNELIEALRVLDEEHMSSLELRGSWAGAMGQCQFMPSTYLRFAIDYDKNGHRDIWDDKADVLASIASYLAAEGWLSGQTWGREVVLKRGVAPADLGLDHQYSLGEWARRGIRSLDGNPLPEKPLLASLIQPDGAEGRSFLVYENFHALMRWNHSTYFAISVGLLADGIH
jgi:membrane-bound lytic murein transglycosylase B